MTDTMEDIMHPKNETRGDPDFPHAPRGWKKHTAQKMAADENLTFGDDHWEAIRALHEFFVKNDNKTINPRLLHDALDEKFHAQGGIKYLYLLFPGGPIAQGCRLAGLPAPHGSIDRGFGSVQ